MMCKTIVALVLVALVASASAIPWKACRQNKASIKGFTVKGCDLFSTCNIMSNSKIGFYLNFFTPEKIQRPVVRMETENGNYNEAIASMSGILGDEAETAEGHHQIIESHLTAPANGYKTNSTVRFTVREYGNIVEDAPVCLEIMMGSFNPTA